MNWLPIRSRIAFKILLLTYQCFNETAPSYLSELLVRYEPGRSLRSSHRDLYVVPPSRLIFMVNGVSGMPPQNYGMTSRIIYNTCGYHRRVQDIFKILPFPKVTQCARVLQLPFAAFYCSNCCICNFLFFIFPLKCIETLTKVLCAI